MVSMADAASVSPLWDNSPAFSSDSVSANMLSVSAAAVVPAISGTVCVVVVVPLSSFVTLADAFAVVFAEEEVDLAAEDAFGGGVDSTAEVFAVAEAAVIGLVVATVVAAVVLGAGFVVVSGAIVVLAGADALPVCTLQVQSATVTSFRSTSNVEALSTAMRTLVSPSDGA